MKRHSVPPRPTRKPHKLEKHGDIRIDPYYWLRERENPDVLRHLEAENAYYEQATADTADFREALFEELKARYKDEDESVPYKYKGYYYQIKYPAGEEYPVFLRWKEGEEKQIFFDANARARGQAFYQPGALKISPDDRILAFAEDFKGRRLYEIRFRRLDSGEPYPEVLRDTTGTGVWAADNRTFFYIRKHPETLRAYRLYAHTLGTPQEEDRLVYEETDPAYDLGIEKSKSEEFIFLTSEANTTTEVRYIPADRPESAFRIMRPRRHGVEYYVYHTGGDRFLVMTNEDGAENFKIMHAVLTPEGLRYTDTFIPHRPDVLLEDLDIFKGWVALTERSRGLTRLRIIEPEKGRDFYIDFPEETYTAYTGMNPETDTRKLRYVYNSLTTPSSVIEFDIDSGEHHILKEEEVADGRFDKSDYRSIRLWAPARDGQKIPVSLVWHKDTPLRGDNPLLLYGYGAYGITVDDHFSKNRLSLLNRGFVFAIAHVRGGEYLGRQWYEEGKLLHKKNTFYDFIDTAEFLIREGITSPGKLFAMGGSAGGLLIGAVANMAPHLFRGMVAQVPFVDVLTTMLDKDIPLTTGEFDEWGNPEDPEFYRYIKSYSPYDQVQPQAYPDMLVTTGFHDSQVQYWEPAKWVAKLRDMNTGASDILFHIDMQAGHGGQAGRYQSLKDTAREYAFILDLAGKIRRT
ncbi:MAG: S9 family peptidase [Chlorobi bacterium]|nr:S9 family peptidase [Chlorobiota bacterium]